VGYVKKYNRKLRHVFLQCSHVVIRLVAQTEQSYGMNNGLQTTYKEIRKKDGRDRELI